MTTRIPLPGNMIDTLMSGLDTGSNLYSRAMQPILERERQKQAQNEFIQDLAIRKQTENRANALMPYIIQQYQDTHRTAANAAQMKELYRGVISDYLKDGGKPTQSPEMPPQMGGSPNAAQGLPQGGQPPASPQIGAGMPTLGDQGAQGGQEHEIRAGNPRFSKLDSVAGLIPEIPKPVTHISNGMVFTTYPSGRMTVQKINDDLDIKKVSQETPEERQKREVQTHIDSAKGIEDAKQASKLESSGRELQSLVKRAQKIKNLLEKNPNLTGLLKGGLASLNLSQSKDLAEFDQTTRKLQADMGRYGSKQGGVQALKWAEKSKPSTYKQPSYNIGMINSILEDAKSDYDQIENEYKERTGKEYPFKFPEIQSDRITIIDSNGDEHTILRENLDEARKRDKGVRVKEN